MLKKVCLLTSVFIILISTIVFAGDVLYRLTHDDQDVLIVGQVVDVNENIKVEVYYVISGQLELKIIDVDRFTYSHSDKEVKVGDKCLLSLDRSLNGYEIKWGGYQVDSTDYSRLSLISENSVLATDYLAIEYYVNSGGIEKDFYFEGNQAFARLPNGDAVQLSLDKKIYPSLVKELDLVGDKSQTSKSTYLILIFGLLVIFVFMMRKATVKNKK